VDETLSTFPAWTGLHWFLDNALLVLAVQDC
jgi:hypothetical protein